MNEQPDSSYKRLKTALVDFVERNEPGAFLLRGEWGVGKTYTCLECMKAEKGENQRAFSYVSLYGISNANEIYTRIALGWFNKISSKFPEWMGEISEQGGCVAKLIDAFWSKGKQVTAVGTAAVGLMARNTIVIIDDLERRDKALSIEAAMGVISYLVESRNCRVILISNDGKLEGNDKKVFELQKEKLFDFEMIYAPTVDENANLAVHGHRKIIIPILQKLAIRNIRVISRIANALSHFDKRLAEVPENVRAAFLPNVAVIAALHHNFREKVDFKELKTSSTIGLGLAVFKDDRDLTETEELLSKVDFLEGPADAEIIAYLQDGYVDISALKAKLSEQKRFFDTVEAERNLEAVYQKFRENFVATGEELAGDYRKICDDNAEILPPHSLHHVGSLLKSLGYEDPSREWLKRWKNANLSSLSTQDLDALKLRTLPKEIKEAIRQELDRRAGPKDLPSVTRRLACGQELVGDVETLAGFSQDDFYDWMITSRDEDVLSVIREVLGQFNGSQEAHRSLQGKIISALKRIEVISPVNRIRVASLRLGPPDEES